MEERWAVGLDNFLGGNTNWLFCGRGRMAIAPWTFQVLAAWPVGWTGLKDLMRSDETPPLIIADLFWGEYRIGDTWVNH